MRRRCNNCGEAASERCLSAAAVVRRLEPKAKRDRHLRYVPMWYQGALTGPRHLTGVAQILVDARLRKEMHSRDGYFHSDATIYPWCVHRPGIVAVETEPYESERRHSSNGPAK